MIGNSGKGQPSMSNMRARDCLIPLASPEPLWEWDVVADALFLSQGARRCLRLSENPRGMADFLAHVPPQALPELYKQREGVLSGPTGSGLEIAYPFDDLYVQESLLVLARGMGGRAAKVMGRYSVRTVLPEYPPPERMPDQAALPKTGLWLFSVPGREIRYDADCAELLGETCPRAQAAGYALSLHSLHPADRKKLLRRYRLFIARKFPGEGIDDIIRVRRGNGPYEHMLLHASVLERDAAGKTTLLAGSLRPVEDNFPLARALREDTRLHFALDTVGDGLWEWDARSHSVYYSPRYLAMLGYTPEQFPPHLEAWKSKIHPDDYDKIVTTQLEIIASPRYGDSFECTYRMRRADGAWVWIFGRGCATRRDADGRALHLVGFITNITTAQKERDKLEELVKTDVLTGLRSRAYCNLEAARIEKKRIRPVCVIFADITGLKIVNDTLGHAAGDELLAAAAMLLRKPLRLAHCAARMGGDEFIVLLPDCAPEKGRALLRKIRECFAAHNRKPERLPVLAAFGLACVQSPDNPLAKAVIQADAAMLRHKLAHRKSAQRQIREWIEAHTGKTVCNLDDRLSFK